MKQLIAAFYFLLYNVCYANAQEHYRLAPPLIHYASVFFTTEVSVQLLFAQPGAVIRYTTNGKPPTENDAICDNQVLITNDNTTLSARAFGDGFLPSDVVTATFYKRGLKIDSIAVSAPAPGYTLNAARRLFDGISGTLAHNNGNWIGFQSDTVQIELFVSTKTKLKTVYLHLLQDQGSWIFLPSKIELYCQSKKKNQSKLISTKLIEVPDSASKTEAIFLPIIVSKKNKTNKLTIKIYTLQQLPAWHAGSGQRSWVFIDEVMIK